MGSHSGKTNNSFYLFRIDHIYHQPTLQGVEAVSALLESTPDKPSYMIGIRENKIIRVPLVEAVQMVSNGQVLSSIKSSFTLADSSSG